MTTTIPAPGQAIGGKLKVIGVTTDDNTRHGKHYKIRAEFDGGPFEGQTVLIVQPHEEANSKPTRKRSARKASAKKGGKKVHKTAEEELEDL